MAARSALVVVVIGDATRRSALARSLAMQGSDLLTMPAWEEALFAGRSLRRQSLLVVDEAAAASHAATIEQQRREGRWLRVIIVASDAPAAANDGHALVRTAPADILSALFAIETLAGAA